MNYRQSTDDFHQHLFTSGIGSQGGKIEEVTSIIDNYDEIQS